MCQTLQCAHVTRSESRSPYDGLRPLPICFPSPPDSCAGLSLPPSFVHSAAATLTLSRFLQCADSVPPRGLCTRCSLFRMSLSSVPPRPHPLQLSGLNLNISIRASWPYYLAGHPLSTLPNPLPGWTGRMGGGLSTQPQGYLVFCHLCRCTVWNIRPRSLEKGKES